MKLYLCLISHKVITIGSKTKTETLKLLEEDIRSILQIIDVGMDFLTKTPFSWNWGQQSTEHHKTEKLLHSCRKDQSNEEEATERESVLASYTSERGFMHRWYKELKK